MKYIGLLMIVISASLIGISKVNKMKIKINLTSQLLTFVQQVKIQLNYCSLSTKEILEEASKLAEIESLDFVKGCADNYDKKPFDVLWSEQVKNSKLNFPKGDEDWVLSFGHGLGTTDLDGQLELCSIYERRFMDRLECYSEDYRKHSKLYSSMGFFIGLAVAMILL